jgi:AcrR family transcriptional regulator
MKENTLKEKIMVKAVELFSEKGYYGTSIREIANAVECSLPMLYYYFKNKNDLYEEIAYVEFVRINERLRSELPKHEHIKKYTPNMFCKEKIYQNTKSLCTN